VRRLALALLCTACGRVEPATPVPVAPAPAAARLPSGAAGLAFQFRVSDVGYAAPMTLAQLRDFPGTTNIFHCVVKEVMPARQVALQGGFGYGYVPVRVRVSSARLGPRPGDELLLRTLMASSPERAEEQVLEADFLAPGSRLLVLGPDAVAVPGDGLLEALTPNGLYALHPGELSAREAAASAPSQFVAGPDAEGPLPFAVVERTLGLSLAP